MGPPPGNPMIQEASVHSENNRGRGLLMGGGASGSAHGAPPECRLARARQGSCGRFKGARRTGPLPRAGWREHVRGPAGGGATSWRRGARGPSREPLAKTHQSFWGRGCAFMGSWRNTHTRGGVWCAGAPPRSQRTPAAGAHLGTGLCPYLWRKICLSAFPLPSSS